MSKDETQWRQRLTDPVRAVAAVKDLVTAELYALVPVGTAPPAWLTSHHPNGERVVPCFLSEQSARLAAGNQAQLVRVPGRDLLGSVPTTSAWIDPQGVGLLITPALSKVILKSVPATEPIGIDHTLSSWAESSDIPPQVNQAWVAVLSEFPSAVSAYWLRKQDSRSTHRRVVVLLRDGHDTPRLLDAMVVVLRANYAGQLRIEAQAVTEGQSPEIERRLDTFAPFYSAQTTAAATNHRCDGTGSSSEPDRTTAD